MFKILIAEDEEITLKHLRYALETEGYAVAGVTDGTTALKEFKKEHYDILITDLKMPGMNGLALLLEVKKRYPQTEVIIITGFGSIESAVDAMKAGAADYITKPFNLDEIFLKLNKILEKKRLLKEITALKISLGVGENYPFIAKSRIMKKVIGLINSIRGSDCNILLTGESGVGKGLIAKLIHYTGLKKDRPFLALSCAVFTEELLASELFGHERGAFTGAVTTKQGLLEVADGGTVFLDEIAEMSTVLQAKLLKVIEDKEFLRVGGIKPIRVDIRLITASNRNIDALVKEGKFREDLYYRLNVMDIYIPPLRERKDDITPLSMYFLEKHALKANKKIKGFTNEAMKILMSYAFPGNVRELENIIERAVILEKTNDITPESLPQSIRMFQIETIISSGLKPLSEVEREYAEKVLEYTDCNKSKASELLGISRTSLWRILKGSSKTS